LAAGAASLQSRLTATEEIQEAEIVEVSTRGGRTGDSKVPEVIIQTDDSGGEGGVTDDV
jgi:hypothetical protein